ncbi:MAG TPA: tRNA epoxyqueuosine(34) reductase QueG [Candidatus Acidoferrales bacterium]|nr:tRNA epoxyqueuosine(34) reductase QueG [Candidatus Acidoferrales bacterium]
MVAFSAGCEFPYRPNGPRATVHLLPDLPTRIKRCAHDAGFDLCGIAPVRDFGELHVFPAWIADGKHGEMKYMEGRDETGELKLASLARVAPWARSVVVCAINYNSAHPYSTRVQSEETGRGWISRYAWSREDYHDAVLRRLRQVEDELHGLLDATGNLRFRSYVDTGPLIERVYAKYAGIGWIGKNTCIINQRLGSWLFLGVILTSLDFTKNDLTDNEFTPGLPAPDRCGTCTRCITACPTHAIVAPGELDARLCISYLTIEKRGEIPAELRSGMGRHVFGCDICQDVCPWNRKAPATSAPEFEPREGLVNPALDWLAEMQPEEFRKVFRGSPVRRTKLSGLRRNAVIAMGNSGDRKFVPTLKKLCEDSDSSVAEHARWALATLGQES